MFRKACWYMSAVLCRNETDWPLSWVRLGLTNHTAERDKVKKKVFGCMVDLIDLIRKRRTLPHTKNTWQDSMFCICHIDVTKCSWLLKHENANVADKHKSFFNNLLPSVLLKAHFSYKQVSEQQTEQVAILAHAMKNFKIILLSWWIL